MVMFLQVLAKDIIEMMLDEKAGKLLEQTHDFIWSLAFIPPTNPYQKLSLGELHTLPLRARR